MDPAIYNSYEHAFNTNLNKLCSICFLQARLQTFQLSPRLQAGGITRHLDIRFVCHTRTAEVELS